MNGNYGLTPLKPGCRVCECFLPTRGVYGFITVSIISTDFAIQGTERTSASLELDKCRFLCSISWSGITRPVVFLMVSFGDGTSSSLVIWRYRDLPGLP